MSNYNYKYNYNKIIDNNKEIDILNNNEKYIINNVYDKYDKYKSVDSFSGLFNRAITSSPRPQTASPSTTRNTNQAQTTRQTTQPIQSTKNDPQTNQNGRAYDTKTMWSPQSIAGKVYEWNRGVVGISIDGDIEKEILDGTFNHHADATVRIAEALGSPIEKTNAPFEAAINCANNGLLIFQSEGDNVFVYFPPVISEEQLNGLIDIVTPRNGFNFSYTHEEQIYEDQQMQAVINFATTLKAIANVARR